MTNPVWSSPNAGDILFKDGATTRSWRRGDEAQIALLFRRPLKSVDLVGGELPPGLFFTPGGRRVQGVVGALPKDQTSYSAVFRARVDVQCPTCLGEGVILANTEDGVLVECPTCLGAKTIERRYDRTLRWPVDPRDEDHRWSSSDATQDLGRVSRGAAVNIQLSLLNPDADEITYHVVGHAGPLGGFEGLPLGLEVDQFGRIVGAATISGNEPGDYYFKVYARAPTGSEGQPRTSERVFKITLDQQITLDSRLSDVVMWETPEGSLGSTWETFDSHFSVRARPQFEVKNLAPFESQGIHYSIVSGRGNLPMGLLLDSRTGLIMGRCPYTSINRTSTFTVRAQVAFTNSATGETRLSPIQSDRRFSLTIRNLFSNDGVMALHMAVPPSTRLAVAAWTWGKRAESTQEPRAHALTVMGRDNLFRPEDPRWGRVRDYRVLLVNGLRRVPDEEVRVKLRDYHRTIRLAIRDVRWARGRSPEGAHIYDVVYLLLKDPMEGAGGFDVLAREQILPRTPGTAIPQWNIKAEDTRYFASSVANMRADLINTTARQSWPLNSEDAATRGLGVSGREALPLWMTCEQVAGDASSALGYQCAIELAFMRPNQGAQAVRSLLQAGILEALGHEIVEVDRYQMTSDGVTYTTFDGDNEITPSDEYTSFDGPNNPLTPTNEPTTFDLALDPVSKYYKFSTGPTQT